MNQLTQTFPGVTFPQRFSSSRPKEAHFQKLSHRIELAILADLLLGLNWTLLHGVCNSRLLFMPEPATHGEWWRWFTHPFVHVTWLHLLLDGAAFLLLYRDLQEQPWMQRFLFCIGSGIGSLLVCFCADAMFSIKGLCGISAIAHGLMAVS